MSSVSQATRWLLRPSLTRTAILPHVPVARLHQQGPSRSAVVHEQALPQSQTQVPPVETSPFVSQSRPQQTAAPSTSSPVPNENANLDALISQIPLVQSLRTSRKAYKESRPHLAIPPAIRQHHFVGGSLAGAGKLALAPYMWTASRKAGGDATSNARASSVVSVFHIGRDLCGHPGFVHGGLLSVLFDEVFARCVSAAFPSQLGMTANLNVDYRKPALPDRLYVLRAETVKVEGRKAWVEGRMSYLPLPVSVLDIQSMVSDVSLLDQDGEGAVMVSEARALFIEPKFADVSIDPLELQECLDLGIVANGVY
ncbi:hypothetical protein N7462_010837 [Penicillium macrosclerotiorum]|uniref:uncharacterized protein n=1 Tax=Penicillium macrosclerotiorum TaxID=303699 RepID=UPI0025498311|nr:uncharacterized protein N7462_010837 [Penicillium macrosclerotiorum]KAJ5669767.1 hypothetical protein N7462_010837 [Penicillium macrosclerotiorum]